MKFHGKFSCNEISHENFMVKIIGIPWYISWQHWNAIIIAVPGPRGKHLFNNTT